MFERNAVQTLQTRAREFRVVAVVGPRQSGKSTLTRLAFPGLPLVNLEAPDARDYATSDPRGFLEHYRAGAILDEAQRVPALFSYLQGEVDRDPRPGRFILTGSHNFLMMEAVTQSLAGRVALLTLLPLAYTELPEPQRTATDLNTMLFRGAFPEVWARGIEPSVWFSNYIETYLDRDVRLLRQVHDLGAFQRFVRLLAASVGQLVNFANLGQEVGISAPTVRAWIGILEASYVVFRLQPHFNNFRKRLVKSPKLYFTDVGLAVRLLGIESPTQLDTHPSRGALFENWVVAELLKTRFNAGRPSDLWFWRSLAGDEIDVLVDAGGKLAPIECKSGSTPQAAWFKTLERYAGWVGAQVGPSTVIYGGHERQPRSAATLLPWRDVGAL